MTKNIRKLSKLEAEQEVRNIALEFATTNGIEGALLRVEPDNFSSGKIGKTPIHWLAVFEAVMHGSVFDGPAIFQINLETKHVTTFVSP